MLPLQPIAAAVPTFAVASVYCFWHLYAAALRAAHKRKERRLRERVTYMLWVMANDKEDFVESEESAACSLGTSTK